MPEKTDSKLFGGSSGPVKLSSSAGSSHLSSDTPRGVPVKVEPVETQPERITDSPEPEKFESSLPAPDTAYTEKKRTSHLSASPLEPNIATSWAPSRIEPVVHDKAFVHPRGLVIGNVIVRPGVFVAPFATIRGDEDEPIFIGEESAVLEGAIVNSLPTRRDGQKLSQRLIRVGGNEHPIFVSSQVTISQGAKIHGPAYIGNNTFIGMGALIFWAKIGSNCVIEPGALVINAEIPDGRFVPAGLSVTSQKIVQTLPIITSKYRFEKINEEMLAENGEIVSGYLTDG